MSDEREPEECNCNGQQEPHTHDERGEHGQPLCGVRAPMAFDVPPTVRTLQAIRAQRRVIE